MSVCIFTFVKSFWLQHLSSYIVLLLSPSLQAFFFTSFVEKFSLTRKRRGWGDSLKADPLLQIVGGNLLRALFSASLDLRSACKLLVLGKTYKKIKGGANQMEQEFHVARMQISAQLRLMVREVDTQLASEHKWSDVIDSKVVYWLFYPKWINNQCGKKARLCGGRKELRDGREKGPPSI